MSGESDKDEITIIVEELIEIETPEDEAESVSSNSRPKRNNITTLFTDFTANDEEDANDEDDEFTWRADDPFEEFAPPAKKIKRRKPRKNSQTNDIEAAGKAKQRYKKDWEKIPTFRKWLSNSQLGPEYFYCRMCKVDAKCGKSEIMRHKTSKKHMRNSETHVEKRTCFEGLICPVFTPIDPVMVDEVNYTEITEYSHYLKDLDVEAVLVNDIVGEGMSLTVGERCLIVEEWAKICSKNKQYLMVQVGGAARKDVIRMVRHAASKKVNALVILPDLYNKPADHYDLLRYLKDIADHAENVLLWYHHNPTYTNVNIDMKKFMIDVAEIESFVGVIFNSGSLEEASVAALANPRLNVIIATEDSILSATACGFTSILSATLNYLPRTVQSLYKDVGHSKLVEARDSQKLIKRTTEIIKEKGHYVAGLKAAMNTLSTIKMGSVRQPLVELWKNQLSTMKEEFIALGIT